MTSLFKVLKPIAFSVFVFVAASTCFAQQPAATPVEPETQDSEKVFTEEIRIPIMATDEAGRFDPTLERDDLLVQEDDVPQEVKSVRRVPSSVMLLLGTGGELNPAIRTSTTREIARQLLSNLREGDQIALLQFNSRTDVLQKWTDDKARLTDALRSKLASGRGSRFSQAVINAASYFKSQPVGNRHLVIVADGVETPGYRLDAKEAMKVLTTESPEDRALAAEAVKALNAAQATVHVISYTLLAREVMEKKKETSVSVGMRQPAVGPSSANGGWDPTLPPGMSRSTPTIGASVTFDPAMRRLRKAYEKATKKGEERLKTFAEETGGRLWLATTTEEMVAQGREVAREIGAQYVVTYKPKRPLATAPAAEYRRVRVSARRIGLQLRARRGYVVSAMR